MRGESKKMGFVEGLCLDINQDQGARHVNQMFLESLEFKDAKEVDIHDTQMKAENRFEFNLS